MLRGIYQNSASMQLLQDKTDVIANNMANVNTAGFKRQGVVFRQYIAAEEALYRNEIDVKLPAGATPTYGYYSDGALQQTGNPLDVALQGDAFFAVQTPEGTRYTRNGEFKLDGQNNLVTAQGFIVQGEGGPIQINGNKVQISSTGQVIVDGTTINTIQASTFNPNAAERQANGLLQPQQQNPVLPAAQATFMQGYVERSNVNIVQEMVDMIATQRHYEANQKLIHTQDSTLGRTVNEVGK